MRIENNLIFVLYILEASSKTSRSVSEDKIMGSPTIHCSPFPNWNLVNANILMSIKNSETTLYSNVTFQSNSGNKAFKSIPAVATIE